MKLSSIILENDHYNKLAKKLENDLRNTYNRDDIHVTMGVYSSGRDANDPLRNKGFGKVEILTKDALPDSEYRNMKNTLKVKGYEITSGSNYYEVEFDNDRAHYPSFKFNFDV